MPIVKIPPVLRPKAGGESRGQPRGRNGRRGARGARRAPIPTPAGSCSPDGELNRYVNVYLNDEDVRVLDGLSTTVGDRDTVVILPAMAGGAWA